MSYPAIDFLYLNEEDMIKAGVEDMKSCIDTIEEMFRLMKKGNYVMAGENHNSHGAMVTFPENPEFPEMPRDAAERRFMAMPAYLGNPFDMAGVKWYGSNVENKEKGLPRSILMLTLNDKDTGAPVAYMSANILSAVRTGAVPGVGIRYLSREDTTQVGIVGPGVINQSVFSAMYVERPTIKTAKVCGSRPNSPSAKRFVETMQERYPEVTFEMVDTIEEACRGSQMITIATSTPTGDVSIYPYVKEEWLEPGTMIICPASARFDDDFFINRARNVADNIMLYEAWKEECGEVAYEVIPIPGVHVEDLIAQGKMKPEALDDLGDILTGKTPVHRKDGEIIIYSVGGMPVEDVAWGTVVYRKAKELGIGQTLNLWDKPRMA